MSTKTTIAYANKEEHGEDFHLYYDYADMQVHLRIEGKEVPLPPRLQGWIQNAHDLIQGVRHLHLLAAREDLMYVPPVGAQGKSNVSKYLEKE